MLRHVSVYLFLLLFSTHAHAQQSPPADPKSPPLIIGAPQQPPISISELRSRPVIGDLGVPLGTCVEIEGRVEAGDKLSKGNPDYLLNVTRVDGIKLETPATIAFFVMPLSKVPLASDHFGLYKLKYQQEAKGLNTEQIEELERDYVGSAFRVIAYETGGFSGIPRNFPTDAHEWADRAYHFSTSLVVVGQAKPSAKVDAAKR